MLIDLKGVSFDYVDNNQDAKKDVIMKIENIGGDGKNNITVDKDNEDQEENMNKTYKMEGVACFKGCIKSESKFKFDIIYWQKNISFPFLKKYRSKLLYLFLKEFL